MADTPIDPTVFRGKITDFNAALASKNQRITTGLTIKRENGFVRFLKILILPLARMFGADPFSHVKANNVALAIFDTYLDLKDQLTDQDKEEVYKLLSRLNQKTGNRHAVLRDIIVPGVEKTVPSHILKKVKTGFDFDIDSAVGTGSVGFIIPTPPPPPPEDGLLPSNPVQTGSKPAVISKEDAHISVIKKEHPRVSGDDMDHIEKMFNYPGAKKGLQRLEEEIEEFIEELGCPEDIEPEDYVHHPILKKYAEQAIEGRNIEEMTEYLEEILLEAIGAARKEYNIMLKSGQEKNSAPAEVTTEPNDDQETVSPSQPINHTTPAEVQPETQPVDPKETLRKEIAIDDELISGNKVKWMQFLIKRQQNAQSYQSMLREVLQWIESGDLEDPEMMDRHHTLKEIKESWEFQNS